MIRHHRSAEDMREIRAALALARRGYGATSPNPMVGAVLLKNGEIIGRGWHRQAGLPHAEIEAIQDAKRLQNNTKGATLYVTLEPCCTRGRTPPCTEAIIAARIKRVVVGATDPNPVHTGKGFEILKRAGIEVVHGLLSSECTRLNEAFNHWITTRTPFVTVKAAMTLDGKIATASGESKWITGAKAREEGMKLRHGSDAILAGVNTILADDPSLTARKRRTRTGSPNQDKRFRRIVLDSLARTPLDAKILNDKFRSLTTIVVSRNAPENRVKKLSALVKVIVAPAKKSTAVGSRLAINLRWLLKKLGSENVTSLLVEGGGEVNGSFLLGGLAQRVAFFYAPKILGGCDARKAVAGDGIKNLGEVIQLREVEWRKLGEDLFMTARVDETRLDGTPIRR
jgi:diaminohydroxyphosphoribosylaminopyrimidine deaminase/5-amino-6-(5-phosphoribosylamino)uracil reductase